MVGILIFLLLLFLREEFCIFIVLFFREDEMFIFGIWIFFLLFKLKFFVLILTFGFFIFILGTVIWSFEWLVFWSFGFEAEMDFVEFVVGDIVFEFEGNLIIVFLGWVFIFTVEIFVSSCFGILILNLGLLMSMFLVFFRFVTFIV